MSCLPAKAIKEPAGWRALREPYQLYYTIEDDDQVVELLVRKHRVKAAAEERVEIEIREASK